MNKSIIGAVVAIVVIAGGVLYFTGGKNDEANTIESSEPSKVISKSEIEMHNTKSDCWTYIRGNVYDITSYVPRHPGGDEILRACGADATSLFEQRTTDSGEKVGSGTPHSSNAEKQLEKLKIGTLDS